MNKQKNSKDQTKEFSIMSQNVSRYEHMLKNSHLKENFVCWMVKLR